MSLCFPEWWEGFRWDSELLIDDLFTFAGNKSAEIEGLKVVPWLPANEEREAWLKQGNGYLWVHRLGGVLKRDKNRGVDEALIQMAGLTHSRKVTNKLMEYVATILCSYDEGGLVQRREPHLSGLTATFMKCPGEVVGPQMIPDRFRDARLIPAQWEIHADLPQGLPDYREVLGLD